MRGGNGGGIGRRQSHGAVNLLANGAVTRASRRARPASQAAAMPPHTQAEIAARVFWRSEPFTHTIAHGESVSPRRFCRRRNSRVADALRPVTRGNCMRRAGMVLGVLAAVASSASAQGLRQKIEKGLFSFGNCGEPLCLAPLVLAGNVHGSHFIPSAESGNAAIIAFLGNAVGTNVSNIPISATTSGVTYRFEGGAPVRTNVSSGPIFAERAQTLGRGR